MSIAEGLTSTEDTAELGQQGPQVVGDQSSPGDRDGDLSDIREQDGLGHDQVTWDLFTSQAS